jgi:Cys-tRNA synthase (O-phospho-L-seryl-tRNA:Cys-tRNA synthase)
MNDFRYDLRLDSAHLSDIYQKQFAGTYGEKAVVAKDNDRALRGSCTALLKAMCGKYDNLDDIDKLASVTNKVEVVRLVMEDNVRTAMENAVIIEDIQDASGE